MKQGWNLWSLHGFNVLIIINLIIYLRLAVFEIHSPAMFVPDLKMRKLDLVISRQLNYLLSKYDWWFDKWHILTVTYKWMCRIRDTESPITVLMEKSQRKSPRTGYSGSHSFRTRHLCSGRSSDPQCGYRMEKKKNANLICYRNANTVGKIRTWLSKFSWMMKPFSFNGTKELISLSQVLFGKQSTKLIFSTY